MSDYHLLHKILEDVQRNRDLEETNHRLLQEILTRLTPPTPTAISFKETSMLPATAGNTLVYTGTLAPAGAQYPADTTFALTSSDPTVTPTVDPTGLIVTIPLPSTFVDNPAAPFSVGYTATSVSNPTWSVTATITPSAPANLPTSISFAQTQ
jgi:hypothetical protein